MFTGKVALITGGASGIGAAIGLRLGRAGARVVLLDADGLNLLATERKLKELGLSATGIECDVTLKDQCDAAVGSVIAQMGGLDILVNNAGITQRSLFKDTRLEVYRRVMEVNFFGALNCTKAALPSIMERRGIIVVISSIAGFAPLYGRTGYAASKHALHGFFTSLGSELNGTGARVLLVCPGFTATNLQTRALDGQGNINTGERNIVGKQDRPEQVAEAVYKAILQRKRFVVLTGVGKASFILWRFFPALYERLMIRNVKGEFSSV